ncbi:MAG: CHAT domain-containing protein [Sphingobacterium sp.]|jgi:hypothetical protein|uniref:CHAT domain-containing protein n=1 Tax=Sphingobacterium sp. TaxID=341027 RepID=UPI00283ADBE1|nr:CHAT domain-containing protein [Sphingobacterium sp.]MDR3007224.1 CHAT domain-containing protein [Sphingobacterium sp.]
MKQDQLKDFFTVHKFYTVDETESANSFYKLLMDSANIPIIEYELGHLFFFNPEKILELFTIWDSDKINATVNEFVDYAAAEMIELIWIPSDQSINDFFNEDKKNPDNAIRLNDEQITSLLKTWVPVQYDHLQKRDHILDIWRKYRKDEYGGLDSILGKYDTEDTIFFDSLGGGGGFKSGNARIDNIYGQIREKITDADNIPFESKPEIKAYDIQIEYPSELLLGAVFDVAFILDQVETPGGIGDVMLADDWVIDIFVNAISGLDIEGISFQSLKVNSENINKPFIFKFLSKTIGEGKFSVMVLHDGRPIFREVYSVLIDKEDADIVSNIEVSSGKISPSALTSPDLTLFINECFENGRFKLKYLLFSPNEELDICYKTFETPYFQQRDPAAYFLDFFNGIDRIPLDSKEQRLAAVKRMEAKGANLYKSLIPEPLRTLFWEIKDEVSTVVINSDEPWIPWELCYLYSEQEGKNSESFFLCEKYDVARWIQSTPFTTSTLSLENMAGIFPSDSGLALVEKEKNEIQKIVGDGKLSLIPANYSDVVDSFERGGFSAWHFSGHGTDANTTNVDHYSILLESKEPISAYDITGLKNLGKSNPIVFFNACQAGKGGMGLTGLNGWPKQFIDNNASAFIGAYWSIHDESAMKFAISFYRLLSTGMTIGQAFRQARLAIKEEGNPTWLAYTLYADPFARCKSS